MTTRCPHPVGATFSPKPRIAFLGMGWIGLNRMKALLEKGCTEVAAIADPDPRRRGDAAAHIPGVPVGENLDDLLAYQPEAVVIATPNALHAEQTIAALERGCAVFCQKPLSRTAAETCQVLRAARCADRLLDVDLSYRHLSATTAVRQVLRNGDIGDIYAAQLVFHNAYGPDKPWFYDPVLSGGGCVLDLGVHLVDLVLWLLDFPEVTDVRSRLFAEGRRVRTPGRHVEDFATAWIELDGRIDVSLACSWNLPAGREAVIEMTMFGTRGGVSIRNVNGSFYDFVAERFIGTRSHRLHEPPDDWGGRAIAGWAERLAVSAAYDRSIEHAATVATVIDRIYGRDI